MHKPLVITKQLDRSSPLLYQALITNESMSRFELRFFAPVVGPSQSVSTLVQNYVVRLTNASIADIEFTLPDTTDPALSRLSPFEKISFTYQKIEWLWTDGGISTTDTWG
jgi:type VI secretion system secreted protein Hcp